MKKFLIGLAIVVLGLLGIASSHNQQNNINTPETTPTKVQGESTTNTAQSTATPLDNTPAVTAPATTATTDQSNLSNNNTYTNVDGNTVHSSASTADDSIPAGATARCVDGTYSFSQHRSGTCSHHGGVEKWI